VQETERLQNTISVIRGHLSSCRAHSEYRRLKIIELENTIKRLEEEHAQFEEWVKVKYE
jgi:hypothetical protein